MFVYLIRLKIFNKHYSYDCQLISNVNNYSKIKVINTPDTKIVLFAFAY